ncbi:Signal transduction histidine kinase [Agromyces sp. CF514]|uniref:sensor histidine kinase n=1 Tax=Agromyces sp. CF514 TaxID=1881031 RepID=UPI0008ED0589|nr:HAMP domain-containing sensor histidine kinase [Agromyces sp. CF514]SFR69959.1 Signal transduction histidine kinase [Agromyces sp. CF514]
MGDAAASAPRTFRLTVRARLALTYAGLLVVAGAVMLAIIAFFIGLVPTYEFAAATPLAGATADGSVAMLSVPSESADLVAGTAVPTYDPGILAETTSASVVVGSRDDILQLLLWVSAGALVVLAAVGAWAGWFVAGRMLRPLQEVNLAAHRAARGHLDHRIALGGPRDEITDLADTFDEMLEGLERSLGAHRRFAANASHELRTPLATTRAMLDVALSSAGAGDAAGAAGAAGAGSAAGTALLERLRETNERSIATVEALLDLSEAEAGEASTEPIELGELAASVVEEARPEAALAGVRIDLAVAPGTVSGDRVLLRQMLVNLVQNGIRHNVRGGVVRVSTRTTRRSRTIEVANSGAELDPATVAELTAPFFRVRGRTSAAAQRGRGLGLSIVAAIAERHGAALQLVPRANGGLRVAVRFPREAAAQAKPKTGGKTTTRIAAQAR